MDHRVWLRISLVFGALAATFSFLGLFTLTELGSPIGQGIEATFSLLGAQSVAAEDCDELKDSSYSPFTIRIKRKPDSERDQSTSSGNSSGSNQNPTTPPHNSQRPAQSPTANNSSPGITLDGGVSDLFSILGILIVAVIIIALLYFLFKNLLGRPIYREAAARSSFQDVIGSGAKISPGDAFSQAETLAARGDYRGALRLLYQGVLTQLHKMGLIDWEKRHTNWEVLRLLSQRGEQQIHQQMTPLTQLFDKSWYGQTPISADEYQTARQATQNILGGVRPA